MRRPFIMFHADATDFSDTSTERTRFITPTVAEYTIEKGGAGSLYIEHPVDEFGKWQTLRNGEIILAPIYRRGAEFPQPFRIYRVTKSRKNGVPVISCDALHIFYDLNYCNVSNIQGANKASNVTLNDYLRLDFGDTLRSMVNWPTQIPLEDKSRYWHRGQSGQGDYWYPSIYNFRGNSNLNSDEISVVCHGETVVQHLLQLAQDTNTELFCDKLYFSLCRPMENSLQNAFNIAYGFNLTGITQTIDDSNVITIFEPITNIEDYEGVPLYPDDYVFPCNKWGTENTGYPFSRYGTASFNYSDTELGTEQAYEAIRQKYLYTDVPGYFAERSAPNVKYTVDLYATQISDEVSNIAGYEVGDSGTIYDPDLGIESYQTITKKVVDLITQRVKSIELASANNAENFDKKWSGIISSGQTALEKRISSMH